MILCSQINPFHVFFVSLYKDNILTDAKRCAGQHRFMCFNSEGCIVGQYLSVNLKTTTRMTTIHVTQTSSLLRLKSHTQTYSYPQIDIVQRRENARHFRTLSMCYCYANEYRNSSCLRCSRYLHGGVLSVTVFPS